MYNLLLIRILCRERVEHFLQTMLVWANRFTLYFYSITYNRKKSKMAADEIDKNQTLLSIVIPTKNRNATLIKTVGAIVNNIKSQLLEIIIQDNSDDVFNYKQLGCILSDARVKYFADHSNISIVENTNRALQRAKGQYITFIGDDDIIAPNILEFVKIFKEKGIQSVIYPASYYWWESVCFARPTTYHSPRAFWYPKSVNFELQKLNTGNELKKTLSEGATAMFRMPRLYHGIVHKNVLTNLQRKNKYIYGASPDISVAIAISHVVEHHYYIGLPLTIYGASNSSGGGWTASKKHFGKIEDQIHLPANIKDTWSAEIPLIWSEHTIYAQSAIEVLTELGNNYQLNLGSFYASMLVNESQLFKLIAPKVLLYLKKRPAATPHFFYKLIIKSVGRAKRSLQHYLFGMPFDLHQMDGPDECMKFLMKK